MSTDIPVDSRYTDLRTLYDQPSGKSKVAHHPAGSTSPLKYRTTSSTSIAGAESLPNKLPESKDPATINDDVVREALERANANASSFELKELVKRLADHTSTVTRKHEQEKLELDLKIAHLNSTYSTLYSSILNRSKVDLARAEVEKEMLKRETLALARKLGPVPTNDPVYAPTARSLHADAVELATAEGRMEQMTKEVHSLKSHLLTGAPRVVVRVPAPPSGITPLDPALFPPTPDAHDRRPAPTKTDPVDRSKKRMPLMGDAESELLLLAGKRLAQVNRVYDVQSPKTPFQPHPASHPGSVQLKPPQTPSTQVSPLPYHLDQYKQNHDERQTLTTPPPPSPPKRHRGHSEIFSTNNVPHRRAFSAQTNRRKGAVTQHQAPLSTSRTSMGGGMDDLLHAAESIFTEGTSSRGEQTELLSPMAGDVPGGSPKRRRVDSSDTRWLSGASTALTPLAPRKSALDVLAEHASTQGLQQHPEKTPPPELQKPSLFPTPGSVPNSAARATTSAAMFGTVTSRILPLSPDSAVSSSNSSGFAPTSQVVHTTPKRETAVKKNHIPSDQWMPDEDKLLVEMIADVGLNWDVIVPKIPNRNYRECKQRFMRDLDGGRNLPENLSHLYPKLQQALKIYKDSNGYLDLAGSDSLDEE
ncbi:hypothetical protein BT69DRAFT_1331039 [Atractiella rhizophila]|nr:hypothetical protein BT69DRAFT_1331039 [Atractiella rhizophila]